MPRAWNDRVLLIMQEWAAVYGVAKAPILWHWEKKVVYYLTGIMNA